MNLTRQYKLWKLGVPMGLGFLEILEFVDSKISNLQKFRMGDYPEYEFYMNADNECVLDYHMVGRYLYVRHQDFWEVLQNKYKIEYSDIRIFLHNKVEEGYGLDIKSISALNMSINGEIEEYYKKLK